MPLRFFALYCAWFYFMRLFICGLQTDLLCVHRDFTGKLHRIAFDLFVENKRKAL